MNSEIKYIFKGVLYTCILFAIVYAAYRIISYKKIKTVKMQSPIITYDDLMNTPEVSKGKGLFEKNCNVCHKILDKDGSNFQNIIDNNYDKKDLYGWIRNSDSVIKSGNKYYVELYIQSNKTQMTPFPNLTDKEIDDIVDYIKVERAQH